MPPASRAASTPDRDGRLVQVIAETFAARELILASPLMSIKDFARQHNMCRKRFAQLVRISWLAPDIVRSVLDGCHAASLDATTLIKADLPSTWAAQRSQLLTSA